MNRHTLIAVAASAVIAGTAAYAAAGAAALEGVQFRWSGQDGFGYVALVNGGYVDVCNPHPIPVRLDGLEIKVRHQGGDFGSLDVGGAVIGPGGEASLYGDGELSDPRAGILAAYTDAGAGGAELARFDPGDVEAAATARTHVFGFIPYSVTHEYAGGEFFDAMDGRADYGC